MNAFNIALQAGRGLDDFLTGGTGQAIASGIKDQGAFRQAQQQIGAGDFDAAQSTLDSRLSDPRQVLADRQAKETARQAAQRQGVTNLASFVDSLPPQQQAQYLQSHGDVLKQFLDLDDDDFSMLTQTVGVPGGFAALAQSTIDPNQQIENRVTQQNADATTLNAETGQANVGVSRDRLGLDRDRFAFEKEQAPILAQQNASKAGREDFKDTQALRKEFSQITADYRDARGSYDRIKTLSNQKTSQSDLALIVAFTKLLDPGSVAREGEVQLTASSQSAIQQVGNWYNRLAEGKTILPDAVRAGFVNAADEIVKSYDNSFDLRSNEFREIANDAGLNPQRVIVGGPAELGNFDLSGYSDEELEAIANGGR